jgi:hypothetical protein
MSQKSIPDISYQLVFCFLPLRNIPIIAQCSKEFKRIVTEPFFFNLFPRHEMVVFKHKSSFVNASSSTFRQMIHQIRLFFRNLKCNRFLIHFNHLESLDMTIDWYTVFDFTPVFQALGSRLLELKVESVFPNLIVSGDDSSTFFNFQSALSFLTLLKILNLSNFIYEKISDLSFLSHMKQLKSFKCDCIHPRPFTIQTLVENLSKCSELTDLVLFKNQYWPDLNHLANLFNALEKTKLIHFGWFCNITQDQQYKLAEILNHFSYLQTIGIELESAILFDDIDDTNIPISLGKWIRHLKISFRECSDQDVIDIISLPHLISLELNKCKIYSLQMKNLIDGLSPRLTDLSVSSPNNSVYSCEISFNSLSRCVKLKSLNLSKIKGLKDEEFHLLSNCKELESITIQSLHDNQITLTIPSNRFPMLKTVILV